MWLCLFWTAQGRQKMQERSWKNSKIAVATMRSAWEWASLPIPLSHQPLLPKWASWSTCRLSLGSTRFIDHSIFLMYSLSSPALLEICESICPIDVWILVLWFHFSQGRGMFCVKAVLVIVEEHCNGTLEIFRPLGFRRWTAVSSGLSNLKIPLLNKRRSGIRSSVSSLLEAFGSVKYRSWAIL